MLIDTHCHIDRFPDPMALASECESAGITTIAVTNVPSHYEMATEHIGNLRYVKPALGFHPLSAAENIEELPLFLSLLSRARFVGEVGLDFSKKGLSTKDQQLEVFQAVSDALAKTPRFVTLHSRRAANDVLAILEESGVKNAVFHWFSDPEATLRKAIAAGHYFSVNTAMLASQSGQRVIENVPRDRILTESDGPYVKHGKVAAKPRDVALVMKGIANMWNEDVSAIEAQVTANFKSLCSSVVIDTP